jgi:hypothetical protein
MDMDAWLKLAEDWDKLARGKDLRQEWMQAKRTLVIDAQITPMLARLFSAMLVLGHRRSFHRARTVHPSTTDKVRRPFSDLDPLFFLSQPFFGQFADKISSPSR